MNLLIYCIYTRSNGKAGWKARKDNYFKSLQGNFPGGPVAKTPGSRCRGPGVQSLVKERDPTCSKTQWSQIKIIIINQYLKISTRESDLNENEIIGDQKPTKPKPHTKECIPKWYLKSHLPPYLYNLDKISRGGERGMDQNTGIHREEKECKVTAICSSASMRWVIVPCFPHKINPWDGVSLYSKWWGSDANAGVSQRKATAPSQCLLLLSLPPASDHLSSTPAEGREG